MEFLFVMHEIHRSVKRWPLALLIAAAAVSTSCSESDPGGGGGQGGHGGSGGATGGSGGAGATSGSGGLAPGECRVQEDCADEPNTTCFTPGNAPTCGACMMPDVPCGDDAVCQEMVGPTSICATKPCFCEPGCVEGCTDDGQCDIGQQCAPDHHCVPKECAGASDCPANFDCAEGTCSRRACTTDADGCEPYCVLGHCYASLGTCSLPPP